jgi:hypothetical protein
MKGKVTQKKEYCNKKKKEKTLIRAGTLRQAF